MRFFEDSTRKLMIAKYRGSRSAIPPEKGRTVEEVLERRKSERGLSASKKEDLRISEAGKAIEKRISDAKEYQGNYDGAYIFGPKQTHHFYEWFTEFFREIHESHFSSGRSFSDYLDSRLEKEDQHCVIGEMRGWFYDLVLGYYETISMNDFDHHVVTNFGGPKPRNHTSLDDRFPEREHDIAIVDDSGRVIELEEVKTSGRAGSYYTFKGDGRTLKTILSAKELPQEEKGQMKITYDLGHDLTTGSAYLFLDNQEKLPDYGMRSEQLKKRYVDFGVGYDNEGNIVYMSELNLEELKEFFREGKVSGYSVEYPADIREKAEATA